MSAPNPSDRMSAPNLSEWELDGGILVEPLRNDRRIVLWIPIDQDRDHRYWDRIGTSPGTEFQTADGLAWTPASLIRTRQPIRHGKIGGILRRWRGGGRDEAWRLPTGDPVLKYGDRRTDLMLVWTTDNSRTIQESDVRLRWPDFPEFRKIGTRICVILGIRHGATPTEQKPPDRRSSGDEARCLIATAWQDLEDARRVGDPRRQAAVLVDLGILTMNEGDAAGAIEHLTRALGLARESGDRPRETDALVNLGSAYLALGQAGNALSALHQGLSIARDLGDRYAEKLGLERLGLAHSMAGDSAGAIALFDQSLAMTRSLGDRQQEAKILWNLAIACAELGRRDEAVARGQDAVDLLRKLGKPEASWYGAQLQRYRMDLTGLGGGMAGSPPRRGGGHATSVTSPFHGDDLTPPTGPGLLRMAVSATKAMMKFVGSGLTVARPEVQQRRLEICRACEHHTGLRCRVCGCFTTLKTRIAHEECPLGKWPLETQ
jgi:Flp pilus assembly protein TadD